MVTKIFIHIAPAERAAAAAEVSNRDVNRLQNNRRNDLFDQSSREEGNQHYRFQGSLNKVSYGGICAGHSCHDNASPRVNNNSKKHPLLLDDADDAEEKKRRKRTQKLIDLTDVPSQPPIISNEKGASSKYQGVYFNKARNKWKTQIMIDGKRHYIGLYANEEQAAVDYARAVFKYKADKDKSS